MRSSACDTLSRYCARCVLYWLAFPSASALRSTGSAAGRPALFVGLAAPIVEAGFPLCVHHRLRLLAFPMRTKAVCRRWPNVGSPRFRRDPFVRDGVFDLGRASAPRITVPHMLPSATLKASASAILLLSRLNRPP